MIGTEKQIKWANEIKTMAIARWNELITEWEQDEDYAERAENARKIVALAVTCENASAWIDARSATGADPMIVIALGLKKDRYEAPKELGMSAFTYGRICSENLKW